jgi:lauroyl/myristoyl acyltransferase
MFDFVVYLLYRAGSVIAAALPLWLLFARWANPRLLRVARSAKYRRLAERNVAIAFANEKSPRDLRRLVRRHFRRLGANLLSSAKLMQMSPEKILRRVRVENIEAMDSRFRAGIPVVLVLSHLGIWELFAQLMPKFVGYVRNASVYQRLGNRFIDAHVRRTRSQTGLELFDRKDGFQPVIDLLRSGGGVGVCPINTLAIMGLDAVFGEGPTSPLCLFARQAQGHAGWGVYTRAARGAWCFERLINRASVAELTSE